MLVKRTHTHGPHPLVDQVTNRVVDHGCGNAGFQLEAVGEVGSTVELSTADVNCTLAGFAKRNNAGIQPMNECSEGEEVERT
jgi:hypothetical protein